MKLENIAHFPTWAFNNINKLHEFTSTVKELAFRNFKSIKKLKRRVKILEGNSDRHYAEIRDISSNLNYLRDRAKKHYDEAAVEIKGLKDQLSKQSNQIKALELENSQQGEMIDCLDDETIEDIEQKEFIKNVLRDSTIYKKYEEKLAEALCPCPRCNPLKTFTTPWDWRVLGKDINIGLHLYPCRKVIEEGFSNWLKAQKL